MHTPPVLVTGGAGLLGTSVIRQLRAADRTVVVLDDGSGGTLERIIEFEADPGIVVYRADIRDRAAVAEICAYERPVHVLHLAGRHFIPDCEAAPDETWQVNVGGTRNLIDALTANPPRRFGFASTADVYQESAHPHTETDMLAPRTVYGASKRAAEALISGTRWPGVVVARLFNLYGPHHTVDHLIPTVVQQAVRHSRLVLGELSSVRDYVFIDDAARACLSLLYADIAGDFNVGTGTGTSGYDLVNVVAKLLDRELTVERDISRLRSHDRLMLVADPGRLRKLTTWWPAVPLDQGLQLVINATKSGSENYL